MSAMTVLAPVPRSWVPHRISTLPSGLIWASALVPRPPPPQAEPAQPMPVLIGPGELPGFLYFVFQPNFSAPIFNCSCRIFDGSFLIRISTGSTFNFTARSSRIDSMPNEDGGQAGARNARAEPALTATADWLER